MENSFLQAWLCKMVCYTVWKRTDIFYKIQARWLYEPIRLMNHTMQPNLDQSKSRNTLQFWCTTLKTWNIYLDWRTPHPWFPKTMWSVDRTLSDELCIYRCSDKLCLQTSVPEPTQFWETLFLNCWAICSFAQNDEPLSMHACKGLSLSSFHTQLWYYHEPVCIFWN